MKENIKEEFIMMEFLISNEIAGMVVIGVMIGLFILAVCNMDAAIIEQENKKPRWRHLKR